MKLSLTIVTLATLLLSAFVQAQKKTPGLRRGLKAGNNGADNYFALVSAAQEDTGCISSALGDVIATVRDNLFCIKFPSYVGLSGPELVSHVHGPAAVGETGPVIFTMDTSADKTQCFELTKDQIIDLDDELWYITIHSSEMYHNGAIRGQILPLLSNVDLISKQLRQTAEAVTEARII